MFCWVCVHPNRTALCFKKFNKHKRFPFALKTRYVYKAIKFEISFSSFKEGPSGRKTGHRLITYTHNIQRHIHAHSRLGCNHCHLHLEHSSCPSRVPVTHIQGPGTTDGNWESFFCSAQTPVSLTAFPIGSHNLFCTSACLRTFPQASNPILGCVSPETISASKAAH